MEQVVRAVEWELHVQGERLSDLGQYYSVGWACMGNGRHECSAIVLSSMISIVCL